jgi:hypothetical protein
MPGRGPLVIRLFNPAWTWWLLDSVRPTPAGRLMTGRRLDQRGPGGLTSCVVRRRLIAIADWTMNNQW